MTLDEIAAFLDRTLQDRKLSRQERQVLTELNLNPEMSAQVRRAAFVRAAQALEHPQAGEILAWLEDVIKALSSSPPPASQPVAEAFFSPGEECRQRIIQGISAASRSLDICVFTITDDRITSALIAAHRRGVALRILTDNDKMHDLGSDIAELHAAGIEVRTDDSPYHMHHKYAIVDGTTLLNGSFNWTRSASTNNEENFIVSNDPRLISAFQREFEKLWSKFARR